jgi:hypothetical protein
MTGEVSMGVNKITNVAYPRSAMDCATKEYVDNGLRRELPFMDVYSYPFTGSDNNRAAYRIAVVTIVDEVFRDTFAKFVKLSTHIVFAPTSSIDLSASAKVQEINGNTMSVRIQVDNKKGSSWGTAFEVNLQVIIIKPRPRPTNTVRSPESSNEGDDEITVVLDPQTTVTSRWGDSSTSYI